MCGFPVELLLNSQYMGVYGYLLNGEFKID